MNKPIVCGGAPQRFSRKLPQCRTCYSGTSAVRFLMLLLFVWALCVHAAEKTPPHPEEVIEVQEAVKGQLLNLRRRLDDIEQRLKGISADDAKKVSTLKEEFRIRNIETQLRQIVSDLKADNYTSAVEMQQRVITHLREMIRRLEGEKGGARHWEEKLTRVKEARKRLNRLLQKQRALRKESEESVAGQAESKQMGDLSEQLDSVLRRQQALASRLPEGPLSDEKRAAAMLKELEGMIGRQASLAEKVKGVPGEQTLRSIRSRAEALRQELSKGALREKEQAQLKELEKQVRSELGDPSLADKLGEADTAGDRKQKALLARALSRVIEKSKKGGLLPAHAPEQAALEYSARLLEEKLREERGGASEKAAGELQNAAGKLGGAADAMKQAVKSLSSGQQKSAVEGQQQALSALKDAQAALGRMNRSLQERDRFARAAAEQKQLNKETKALEKEAERLQRKLADKERRETVDQARELLKKAAQSMEKAAGEFSNQRLAGRSSAGRAADQLKQARERLKKEGVKRLKRQEALRKLAEKQDGLKKETDDLAQKLKSGEEGVLRRSGPRLDRAGGEMQRASKSFRGDNAAQGAEAQKKAEDALAGAEEALRKEEDELERLRQEEQLTNLVELLVSIRERQEKLFREIVEADGSRTGGRFPRRVLMVLRNAAKLQEEAIADGEHVQELLQNEKAQVFAFVVEDILGDMEQIHESIGGRRPETGRFVQVLARDVIDKIDKLLQAMKNELSERKQPKQQKPMPGMQGRKVLVPPVAEAMMLKRMQLDINEKVQDLERSRQAAGGELNEPMERFLKRLALKQGALATLTKKVAKDFFGEVPGEEQSEGDGQPKEEEQ